MPNVTVFGSEVLREATGHKGVAFMNGISALMKDTQMIPL